MSRDLSQRMAGANIGGSQRGGFRFARAPTQGRLMAGGRDFHRMGDRINEAINEIEAPTADSGASATYPKQCSAIRKNEYVMIKGRPCKVVEMSTSKTGKHGYAKVHMVALDIFTNKKLEDTRRTSHNMDVPVVKKKEFQLLSISDEGYLSLMDLETRDTKDDLRIPDGELGVQIKANLKKDEDATLLVSVVSACGEEQVLGWKVVEAED
ncbi:Eukaryotic translation initiation factor 5A [Aphelenchoides fujianensis]|nr:Eukaryotic translation initiation factor 5A [Aphelenchoides fujianensis]